MRFFASFVVFVPYFLFFFAFSPLQGDEPRIVPQQGMVRPLNVHFERLTIDNGLSQSSIFAMMQDKYGYLWFCTQDGLNRFDGYQFTIFRNRPEDSLSLAVNWVNDVYQAPSGRIWAMTRSSVNLYLPASEQFRSFLCTVPKRVGRTGTQTAAIASVLEDAAGDVWIATDKGLFVIQNASSPMQATVSFVEEFAGKRIFALALDSAKTLVLGTSDGLFYKTKNATTFSTYALSGKNTNPISIRALTVSRNDAHIWAVSETELFHITSLGSGENAPFQRISLQASLPKKSLPTALHLDSHGTVWISLTEGLCTFIPKTAQIHAFTAASGLAGNTIYSFAEDSVRRVWIGTGGGINIFEHSGAMQKISQDASQKETQKETQKAIFPYHISTCLYQANDPQSLSNAIVRSLICDRTGTMWAGTDNGINSWNQLRYKFHTFGSTNNAATTFSNTSIRAFLSSSLLPNDRQNTSLRGFHPDSTLWVGTDDGLNLYDRRTNTWRRFGKDDGLANTDIRALAWSEAGELIIGTNGGGLFRYNGKRFRQEIYDAETPNSLNSNRLRALYTDRSGTLWAGLYAVQGIATRGATGGLAYLPKGETSWRVLTSDGTEKTPSENDIRYLYSEDGANLWIGTHGGGLNYFDAATRTFTHFKHAEKDSTSISSNIVSCILRSKAGALWVATASGLNEFNPATRAFTRYTVRDGLPNDFVYGILEDNDGNLWLSTNKGVSCFTPRTRSFRNYDRRDGLPSNEFNSGAFCKLPLGEMLFGSMNGFVLFPPDNIRDSKHAPPVMINSIKVMNTPRLFDVSLAELEFIRLPYNENFLAFEFSVLDFITPERNKYAYKLDGVDNTWIVVRSDRRYAAYSDLDAGEYTFRVKATNADGVWNEQERRLRVVIIPPFWQTWWFKGIMLLAAMVCLWAAYRGRVSYIQRRNKVLERLVHDRTTELEVANHELNAVNDEMSRQNHILEEQTAQIEIANTQLQEKYIELGILNEQLEDYTEEMERYSAKLEEQTKVIEEKNSQLQDKNDELAIVNEQLEDYTEEMERYSAKLEEQAREITAASTRIQEQNAALQDLNTRKNELIGVVAHDLKNPLSAILMSSSLMLRYYEKMTKDDHLQNTQRIKETGERMNKIITDLLDIEAIESGKFKLNLEECDITEIVHATVNDYQDAATRKQISILTESPPHLALGYADTHALRQILDNLVSNAVKYSPPERRIWLVTREAASAHNASAHNASAHNASAQSAPAHDASTHDETMLMVDVRDEGPGLSDEDQTKLFGRFAKLTPQPTGGEHSTGLGLSIVKQLAEAMGGTVRCSSALGVGTTFTVEIPKKKG